MDSVFVFLVIVLIAIPVIIGAVTLSKRVTNKKSDIVPLIGDVVMSEELSTINSKLKNFLLRLGHAASGGIIGVFIGRYYSYINIRDYISSSYDVTASYGLIVILLSLAVLLSLPVAALIKHPVLMIVASLLLSVIGSFIVSTLWAFIGGLICAMGPC